jgi:hypothetical protein
MSSRTIDFDSALRRIAERRIEDATHEGKFDNLPGAGKPLDLEPMPAEESARMTWWMLRVLRNNDFTPDEVRLRKEIERLKSELEALCDERLLDPLVARINALVQKVNTLGTNAINLGIVPIDIEQERSQLRRRLAGERVRR